MASLHRLRHDLGREIVVAVCSVVLMATFFYVFDDFLNVEVKSLSAGMRDAFATGAAYIVLMLALAASQRAIRLERFDETSLSVATGRMGEHPQVLLAFLAVRILTILIIIFGIAWAICFRFLVHWTLGQVAAWQSVLLILLAIWQFWAKPPRTLKSNQNEQQVSLNLASRDLSPISAMARWRLTQILLRNRLTRVCIALSSVFVLLVPWTAIRQGPFFAAVLASFVAGVLVAITLAFQLADDLDYAWAERCMGISHQDFMSAYYRVGAVVGGTIGMVLALAYLLPVSMRSGFSLEHANEAAKLAVIGFLPAFVMPLLALQVDGRRPAIQIMMLVMFGLFLATAVYASWLSIILLPLLKYYAEQSQNGRFYRA